MPLTHCLHPPYRPAQITLPVLILHGTADEATQPSGRQQLHGMVGSRDKTLRLYDRDFHDLLNDLGKETVMADILGWVENRIPVAT